jgi:hypothetical protein
MRVNEDSDDWVVIGLEPGARQLAFQRASTWVPPRGRIPSIRSNCISTSAWTTSTRPSRRCWRWAPRRLDAKRESGFRVFSDPVGHPFCLVFGGEQT